MLLLSLLLLLLILLLDPEYRVFYHVPNSTEKNSPTGCMTLRRHFFFFQKFISDMTVIIIETNTENSKQKTNKKQVKTKPNKSKKRMYDTEAINYHKLGISVNLRDGPCACVWCADTGQAPLSRCPRACFATPVGSWPPALSPAPHACFLPPKKSCPGYWSTAGSR